MFAIPIFKDRISGVFFKTLPIPARRQPQPKHPLPARGRCRKTGEVPAVITPEAGQAIGTHFPAAHCPYF